MKKSFALSPLHFAALALLGLSACAHALDPAPGDEAAKGGASNGDEPSSYGGGSGGSEAGSTTDAARDDGSAADASIADSAGDAIVDADIFVSGDGGCGEALCTPILSADIGSHFTGLGCTGTESYYTPYNGYDGIRRSWDGHGLAGTILRTVTNTSFKSPDGTCTDDWPSGNTLSDFVTIYR